MFRDLQPGYGVSALDKGTGVAKFKTGTVKSVGQPRIDTRAGVPFNGGKVVDLIVEVDGQTLTYVVPEGSSIVVTEGLTLSCDPSLMVNEVRAFLKRSEDAIAMVDNHRKNVEACKEILGQISPAYASDQAQARRLDSIERSVADMSKAMAELMEQLKTAPSAKKNEK